MLTLHTRENMFEVGDVCIPSFAEGQFVGEHGPLDFKILKIEENNYHVEYMLDGKMDTIEIGAADALYIKV